MCGDSLALPTSILRHHSLPWLAFLPSCHVHHRITVASSLSACSSCAATYSCSRWVIPFSDPFLVERDSYTFSTYNIGGVDISRSCVCWLEVFRRMWGPCIILLILSCSSLLFSSRILIRMHFWQGILSSCSYIYCSSLIVELFADYVYYGTNSSVL